MNLCEFNPLSDRIGFRGLYFSPYVFSNDEVKRVLQSFSADTSKCKSWGYFLPRLSRYCVFLIIAHCGLRISEACRLRVKDIRVKEGALWIEKTKFRKDRMIPISRVVMREIQNYIEVRNHHPKSSTAEYLFLNHKGSPYSRKTLGHFFHLKMRELRIYRSPFIRGTTVFGSPSPHSLRHSFAVRTVRQWQANNFPIDQISDTLATYMGHSAFSYTQVYLKTLSTEPGILIFKPFCNG
jgi:integrase/recombinase XerD